MELPKEVIRMKIMKTFQNHVEFIWRKRNGELDLWCPRATWWKIVDWFSS